MAIQFAANKTGLARYLPLPNRAWSIPGVRGLLDSRDAGAGDVKQARASNGTTAHASDPSPSQITYSVVHHIKGRIRLRIPRLAYDSAFAQRLECVAIELPGVTRVRVNMSARSLIVDYRPESSTRDAGRTPNRGHAMLSALVECIRVAAGADVATDLDPHASPQEEGRINYMERLGLPALGIGLSAGVAAGLGIPYLLVGGAVLASAAPIFQRTAQGIRDEKRLTVDFLDASAIVLLTAQASFLMPAIVVGIIEGSEITRDWTARRSRRAELDLLLAADRTVVVERDGRQEPISIDDIVPGDTLVAYPGDQIAVDGLVIEGRASLDQRQLTGDSALVDRRQGDEVYASSLVADGHVRILARQVGSDTHIATVHSEIAALPLPDTRISNHARKVGNRAVVPTLLVGGAVFATSGSVARLSGIVSLDIGTGMRVSAPIAVLAAQSNAARQGILVRSGRALEMLAEVDTVVFDKTATLTQGRAAVVGIEAHDEKTNPVHMLALAASAEQELDHPVAQAIVARARQQDAPLLSCTSWNYVAGQGVTATVDGQVVQVGNRRMMQEMGMAEDVLPASDSDLPAATPVYVACNGQLLGRLYCADPVRAESADVIARLHRMDIVSLLLSGDNYPVSQAVAVDLGIAPENIYAEILPQRKVDVVQSLQARGRKVAVVGDGVNDVAAMAHAGVSIAMGSATDLARETADIVLMGDDLRDLLVAVEIAKHSMQIIRQNRALVVVPNVAAIAYSTLIVMSPVAGVVINNGTALVAALNSLRPLRGPGKDSQALN